MRCSWQWLKRRCWSFSLSIISSMWALFSSICLLVLPQVLLLLFSHYFLETRYRTFSTSCLNLLYLYIDLSVNRWLFYLFFGYGTTWWFFLSNFQSDWISPPRPAADLGIIDFNDNKNIVAVATVCCCCCYYYYCLYWCLIIHRNYV